MGRPQPKQSKYSFHVLTKNDPLKFCSILENPLCICTNMDALPFSSESPITDIGPEHAKDGPAPLPAPAADKAGTVPPPQSQDLAVAGSEDTKPAVLPSEAQMTKEDMGTTEKRPIKQTDGFNEAALSQVTTDEPTEGSLITEQALKSHPAIEEDQSMSLDDISPNGLPVVAQSDSSSFSAVADLDVDTSDTDSAIGSMNDWSSTQSTRSSIYDFVEENGRKYHRFREGRYHLPNDEIEQDRLNLQHHLFRLTLSSLYLAPIKDLPGGLHRALDIATGTGIWAIEFANEFPQASVLGMDLSPIQPDFVPANCSFEVDDADDEWIYSHQFDYIHARAVAACFKSHQVVFNSAFKFLRPGGYFEVQDVAVPVRGLDDTFPDSAFNKWQHLAISGGAALGKDFCQVPKYKSYFEAAGFVDIVEKRFVWPLGTWAKGTKMKVLGSWAQEDMLSAVPGISMAVMTRGLGMKPEEVELSVARATEDLKSNKVHMYMAV